ncbi:hypothetical protein PhCBS80983_g06185 [Powellomyces hirtus]|uniref:Zona occludens toxin N-terminal domain-containing protein n=1 Tax=Powellomyces hirtus TaxID=109895 RepID=A0A507DQE7_9FUNG|nr:hypothetical protein PhCBS80983_g06185 [Powellomyces hirtus]
MSKLSKEDRKCVNKVSDLLRKHNGRMLLTDLVNTTSTLFVHRLRNEKEGQLYVELSQDCISTPVNKVKLRVGQSAISAAGSSTAKLGSAQQNQPSPMDLDSQPSQHSLCALRSVDSKISALTLPAHAATGVTPIVNEIPLHQLFFPTVDTRKREERLESVLLGAEEVFRAPQYGVLGSVHKEDNDVETDPTRSVVCLNTHAPFCLVALGVQGSGKSHSIATVIESCMLHAPPFVKAQPSVSTMVFHFDQDPSNYCEAITLTTRQRGVPSSVPVVSRMVVLVSPSYYIQRKEYYKQIPNCTVLPLLLRWSDLNAEQIKQLMRIEVDDTMPLYMSVILDMLRKMQKDARYPTFGDFKTELVQLELTGQQNSPLAQRLRLIESYRPNDVWTRGERNLQVMLSKFLTTPTRAGKLAVFDEAHKYLQHSGNDGLSAALVSAVRQMRHHGVRLAISTQSPKVLPPELLELLSVALIHRFHSKDWFHYLRAKLCLPSDCFGRIMELDTGSALVFSSRWAPSVLGSEYVRKLRIRSRVTADGGVSKVAMTPEPRLMEAFSKWR